LFATNAFTFGVIPGIFYIPTLIFLYRVRNYDWSHLLGLSALPVLYGFIMYSKYDNKPDFGDFKGLFLFMQPLWFGTSGIIFSLFLYFRKTQNELNK
jgi:hypothetical protein